MATIKFTYALKRFYPELQPVELEGKSVALVVDKLDEIYKGMKHYLLDDQGALRKHVNIFVDGSPVADRLLLSDEIDDDTEVYIMQALSGG